MSVNLASLYGQQFSTNVALLLQQKGSRLRDAMTVGTYTGSQASPVDQLAAVEAQEVTSRFEPMPRVDASVDRRWVFPTDVDLPQLVDKFDKLRLFSDPGSMYTENAVYGLGRKIDSVIYAAMFGTAKTGVSGGTSTILPTSTSTNVVGVSTGGTTSNLNVAKLRTAKKFLMAAQVDLDNDPIYCAITSAEHDSLLNEIQVISADFNGGKPVLDEGRIKRFLGINFIHYESLTTGTDDAAGTSTAVPLWAKSGMHLGIWSDVESSVTQRDDIRGLPWQVYAKMTIGATRLEEKKMIKIWCR